MRTSWTDEERAALVELVEGGRPYKEVASMLQGLFGNGRSAPACVSMYRLVKGIKPYRWELAPLTVRILLALQDRSSTLSLRELAERLGIRVWDDPNRTLLRELRRMQRQGLVRRSDWHWSKTDKGHCMRLWGPNAMSDQP